MPVPTYQYQYEIIEVEGLGRDTVFNKHVHKFVKIR
jgi:hypothetical protein